VRTQRVRMHDALDAILDQLPPSCRGHVAHFKLYAPFGAQVAALSQIAVNKSPGEIASDGRTTVGPTSLGLIGACVALGRAESKVPRRAVAQSSSGGTVGREGGRVGGKERGECDSSSEPSPARSTASSVVKRRSIGSTAGRWLSRLVSRPRKYAG
jgi:hypothetical protein